MPKPIIGVSMYREAANWGSWRGVPADLLPAAYADCVVTAGGIPVLLPSVVQPGGSADADAAQAQLERVNGLIVAGGADVDPAAYGCEPGLHTGGWRPGRDASELALLDAATARNVPTLGICRGMQMMAVAAGGALEQHVPDRVGHERHSPGPGVYGEIDVIPEAGTAVHRILGDRVTVPCHHHQAVATYPGFEASAHAVDGTLEAMEDRRRPFWLAVQWHPETGTDMRLFESLVAAAVRTCGT